jgi:cholesterol oxidase
LALRVLHTSWLGGSDRPVHPRTVRLRQRSEPISDSFVFMIFGRDAANGQMRLTPFLRRLEIDWNRAASDGLFAREHQTVDELAHAADANSFYPLDDVPGGKFVTVHPLGGCPMADDSRSGVVTDTGRVHGYDRLIVLDGSIVPTAIGVNPSKTIAALAERGIARFLEESS